MKLLLPLPSEWSPLTMTQCPETLAAAVRVLAHVWTCIRRRVGNAWTDLIFKGYKRNWNNISVLFANAHELRFDCNGCMYEKDKRFKLEMNSILIPIVLEKQWILDVHFL